MTRHQVFDHSASDVPEVLNQSYNVSDNDNQTRWACTGECWIQLDLGEQKTVDAVAVSYMKGNERRYKFDILVSNDGETWTKVLENVSSSGTTEDIELYRFEKSYSAKYVRYLGYGSDVNVWNSITEFAALENK